MRLQTILTCAAFGLASACGAPSTRPTTPARDYAGPLRAPSSYAADFAIDHQITAIHAQGSDSFRALIEKVGNSLTIVGLGPHGSRAFTLTQVGDDVAFESQMPRELPFPPRYMLIDVHRTWLFGAGEPRPDGTHELELETGSGTEQVTETWADGRLLARSFRREPQPGDPPDAGPIRITYRGGLAHPSAPAPAQIELDNGWFGYQLMMENITRTPI